MNWLFGRERKGMGIVREGVERLLRGGVGCGVYFSFYFWGEDRGWERGCEVEEGCEDRGFLCRGWGKEVDWVVWSGYCIFGGGWYVGGGEGVCGGDVEVYEVFEEGCVGVGGGELGLEYDGNNLFVI